MKNARLALLLFIPLALKAFRPTPMTRFLVLGFCQMSYTDLDQQERKVPVLVDLLAAGENQILVTGNNAGFFAPPIPHAIFQTIGGIVGTFASTTQSLFTEDPSIDRRWIQFQTSEKAANFFKSSFKE